MKPHDFRYERPATLSDALVLMAESDVEVAPLAGGQSLMPMMNFRLAVPEVLVDLGGLEQLQGITVDGEVVRIGAMTRYADLERSDVIATHLPLIKTALPHIAHSAIRNRGTIGGSLALADPAAEMPALMLALNASLVLQSAEGQRTILADDYFLGFYETAREPNELIVEIVVPIQRGPFGFYEITRRHGDYAMAGVALAIEDKARIALFSVSDQAIRAPAAEAVLSDDASNIDGAVAALSTIEFAGDLNGDAALKQRWAGISLRRAMEMIQ